MTLEIYLEQLVDANGELIADAFLVRRMVGMNISRKSSHVGAILSGEEVESLMTSSGYQVSVEVAPGYRPKEVKPIAGPLKL
jgi:hypothetical protein